MSIESFWIFTAINVFLFVTSSIKYNQYYRIDDPEEANIFLGFVGYSFLSEVIVLGLYFIPQLLEHIALK